MEEEGIAPMLEERKPRKIKMVHLRCTACGEERWVNWKGRTTALGKPDYGFLSIREHGCESVFDGDETYCPACGDRVIAKKAAKLGNGYHVSATAYFMSALLLPDRALALTGWRMERRFGRSGGSYLHAQPYDAYVFTDKDCAKLTGWSKQYGQYSGYFKAWNPEWRQPQRWVEGWGQETDIFGLTPELVAESQLPHCKLYEYMAGRLFSPNASPAPIAYLRLYQAHPNVETLVTAGLPNLLDELMAEEMRGDRWESNNRGKLALPEIHWKEKRPSAMLGLTREELRQARKQGWGQYFWRLYTRCLAHGEKLTEEDLRNIWYLGDEHLLPLIGRGPVGKSVRYLLHQAEMADAWETAETDPEGEHRGKLPAGLLDHGGGPGLRPGRPARSLAPGSLPGPRGGKPGPDGAEEPGQQQGHPGALPRPAEVAVRLERHFDPAGTVAGRAEPGGEAAAPLRGHLWPQRGGGVQRHLFYPAGIGAGQALVHPGAGRKDPHRTAEPLRSQRPPDAGGEGL